MAEDGSAAPKSPVGPLAALRQLRGAVGAWLLLPVGLSLPLLAMAGYSYLLFHTFAELFAVIVGVAAFVVAMGTFRFARNHYLMAVGTGYFWVALLDLLHALTYRGLNVLPPISSPDPASQFWLAARGTEACVVLLAPIFLQRRASRAGLILLFGVLASTLAAFVASGNFPATFIPGQGLTPFKIGAEYAVIGAIAAAMVSLWRRRALVDPRQLVLILAANACTIAAELAFTLYADVFALSNLVGHIIKLFAFSFIFLAVVRFTLWRPFEAMAEAEEKARRSERDLAMVLDGIPGMVAYWDRTLRNRFANRAYAESVGRDPQKLKGMHMREGIGAEFVAAYGSYVEGVLRGEPQRFERDYPGPGGETRHALVQYVPDVVDGEVAGYFVLATDLTALKSLEQDRDRLRQQLQQAQKMQALGQLTGGLAHDFNNILAAILGYAELALARQVTDQQGKLAEYLRQIRQAGQRARELADKMLAFARGGASAAETVDVQRAVRETAGMLRAVLPATIELEYDLRPVPAVRVAPTALQQVITNLVINARDALGGAGRIVLGTALATTGDGHCDSCGGTVEGRYVAITVADDGPGIPADVRARIFDPFFTTKAVGKGTGLGLSVVHGLVHEAAGHILVDVAPGEGTAFRILLPPADGMDTAAEPAGPGEAEAAGKHRPAGRARRIMVVDDEPALARLIGETLTEAGYQPRVFSSSREALAAFRADPGGYAALVTDQTMPGLTGLDLLREVRALQPGLPVLMASGYSDAVNADNARGLGIDRFFQKPLLGSQLVAALGEIIGDGA